MLVSVHIWSLFVKLLKLWGLVRLTFVEFYWFLFYFYLYQDNIFISIKNVTVLHIDSENPHPSIPPFPSPPTFALQQQHSDSEAVLSAIFLHSLKVYVYITFFSKNFFFSLLDLTCIQTLNSYHSLPIS